MASAGDIHSILYRGDVLKKPFQPKFDPSKRVKRYFPGQEPDHALSDEIEESDESLQQQHQEGLSHAHGESRRLDTRNRGQRPEEEVVLRRKPLSDSQREERKWEVEGGKSYSSRRSLWESRFGSEDVAGEKGTARRSAALIEDEEGEDEEGEEEEEVPIEEARPVKRRRREVIEPLPADASAVGGGVRSIDATTANDDGMKKKEASSGTEDRTESGGMNDRGEEMSTTSIDDRRERIRLKALEERRKEEERLGEKVAAMKQMEFRHAESEEEDEEDNDDEEEAEDEDDEAQLYGLKPIFIPAAKRESVKEKQALEMEEVAEAERKKQQLEERKKESRKMLIETVQRDEEDARRRSELPSEFSMEPTELPDDNDAVDEETEYELWKIRELKRIKRDQEEELVRLKEIEQIERRRRMTEEERREDDKRLDASRPEAPKKGKYAFLQKYYHRGAFYQDLANSGTEPIYLRDFNQQVGDDAVDKKALPRPMQVRRGQFGKAGQVKHTHLAAEDTTDFSSAWVQVGRTQTKHQETLGDYSHLRRPSLRPVTSNSTSQSDPPHRAEAPNGSGSQSVPPSSSLRHHEADSRPSCGTGDRRRDTEDRRRDTENRRREKDHERRQYDERHGKSLGSSDASDINREHHKADKEYYHRPHDRSDRHGSSRDYFHDDRSDYYEDDDDDLEYEHSSNRSRHRHHSHRSDPREDDRDTEYRSHRPSDDRRRPSATMRHHASRR